MKVLNFVDKNMNCLMDAGSFVVAIKYPITETILTLKNCENDKMMKNNSFHVN